MFQALTGIPTLLDHPNLTLHIVMVVDEDIRVPYQGRRRRRRRDWVSIDRRLLEVIETHTIQGIADLFAMIDAPIPEAFTSRDLAEAMGASRRLGQQAAFCFREAGLTDICGKRDRFLLYRRAGDLPVRRAPGR